MRAGDRKSEIRDQQRQIPEAKEPEVRPARHREPRCSGESGGGRKGEGPEVGDRMSEVGKG